MLCEYCEKEMVASEIRKMNDCITLIQYKCEEECEENRLKTNEAQKPKMIQVEDKNQWESFLRWYDSNIGEFEWHPITPADRVNIYDNNEELIAYKCFYMEDEFFIRNKEYDLWKIGG